MTIRSLTVAETALAESVFGNSIDYTKVRITADRFIGQPDNSGLMFKNTIHQHGSCYRDDYAEAGLTMQGHFIHEMAHVWQYQNDAAGFYILFAKGRLRHAFDYGKAYPFTLEAGKDLLEYNLEQQACIVQENFMSRQGAANRNCRNNCSAAEKELLYNSVLEKFLENPSYAKKKSNHKPPASSPKI
jgi:hypothetical protein